MTKFNNTQDLITYAARLGEDAIVFGHRISKWSCKETI